MALSSPGIGSNLDVNSIVSQLMSLESKPLNTLNQQEASYQAELTGYGSLKSALSTFQSALQGLTDSAKFAALSATPADTTALTASASSAAMAGNYAINVTTLAQAQKLVATGQTDVNTAIGSGTVTFDFGTISGGSFNSSTGKYTGATFTSNGNGSKSIAIDSSNNSLQGIRDAINSAQVGVTATIINDGGTSPYRLVLTSNNPGISNSVKISVSGDTALSNLVAQDPAGTQNLSETLSAQNANLTVDGIAVSKTSNTISDAIPGVTFTLLKASANTTLSVSRDTNSVQSSVQAFVKAYNDVNKTLSDLSAYNSATKKGAVLQGDATVRTIQTQIRNTLTSTITALTGGTTLLSQIGVSFQKDGTLSLDAAKLQNVIANSPGDVAGLFAAVGKTTDSLISYVSASTSTKPGKYAVTVTQLATQGKSVGAQDISAGATISSANDTLNVLVDGVPATLTLDHGTYTATSLASQIQSKINGASAISSAGSTVTVAVSGTSLSITSSRYGSASKVSVTGGTAQATVFGSGTDTAGVDVAGTINGAAATGSGQTLTGTGDAAGLNLLVAGGALGNRGFISYSQGYAYKLNQLATAFIGSDGLIAGRTDGISKSIQDIANRRDAVNRQLADTEQRYRAQFTALDTLISNLNQTSTFLTQQLANLPKIGG
jgi:flagellar hook-associated protein 2